jgi:hypothetical protein
MPVYEVLERQQIVIGARRETTLASGCRLALQRSRIVRSILRARDLLLGGKHDHVIHSLGLVNQAKAWSWAVLVASPCREIGIQRGDTALDIASDLLWAADTQVSGL